MYLTLGDHLKVEASTESTGTWDDTTLSVDAPYLLQPGEFILPQICETPTNHLIQLDQ